MRTHSKQKIQRFFFGGGGGSVQPISLFNPVFCQSGIYNKFNAQENKVDPDPDISNMIKTFFSLHHDHCDICTKTAEKEMSVKMSRRQPLL